MRIVLERLSDALKKTMSGLRPKVTATSEHEVTGTVDVEVLIAEDPLDGGYIATCVNVPGASSQGETPFEAMENLSDALAGILAARFDRYVTSHQDILLGNQPAMKERRLNVPVEFNDHVRVPA